MVRCTKGDKLMANNENLKPIQKGQLSKDELKKRQSNGGKKSGEVRRARKTLKEDLLFMLSTGDTQEQVNLALIKQALKGNIKAFLAIRDTIGEMPVTKQEITGVDGTAIVQKVFVTPDEVKEVDKHIKEVLGND